VVSFTPQPLYPQGKSPGTHWIGDWVGPRAVLDAVVKRKIPSPRRESNRRTPIVQPRSIPTELPRLPKRNRKEKEKKNERREREKQIRIRS
jgi:hypothetical protein